MTLSFAVLEREVSGLSFRFFLSFRLLERRDKRKDGDCVGGGHELNLLCGAAEELLLLLFIEEGMDKEIEAEEEEEEEEEGDGLCRGSV